jgi:hypothetical protein
MATRTPKATPTAMYFVSETTQRAVETKAFSYGLVAEAGKVSSSIEHDAVMALFSGAELPTFKGFQDAVKADNATKPVKERAKIPTAKTAGYGAIYQMFNNLAKIREAETEHKFNALAYWNAKGITAKRETEPNISYILKGARAVINGEKEQPTPFEIFEKGLKLAYKGALEFKNDKKAQQRVAKLIALASADGITLEAETETDTEE